MHEAEQYELMSDLDCIPRLKGLAEVWNMLLLLIMESAGCSLEEAILEEQQRASRKLPSLWGGVGVRHGAMKALKTMHAKGLVHGDMKLDNIMFDIGTGQVKLIDFGLTKLEGRAKQRREVECLNELLLEAEKRAAKQVAEYKGATFVWGTSKLHVH
uniref:Protein kinase domain-containing protein n=1 Tax=Peronospora matthiolae TaxID=2874970 RepID=A0AAV1T114_9STRA